MQMNVELHISCRKLKNLDIITKSDPQVTMYVQNSKKQWREFGKTELIMDNLNPDFKTYFTIGYQFEKHQRLRFEVLDIDPVDTSEFIGYIETSMGQIMGAKDQSFVAELKDQKGGNSKRGQIIVKGVGVNESNHNVIYQIKCKNIKNTTGGCFGIGGIAGKVRYEIRRQVGKSNHWASCYTSFPVEGTKDPIWQP